LRQWSDGEVLASRALALPRAHGAEVDLGPDLIDWLEEVRKDWRAGIRALFASLRLALTGALGVLQGGSGWDTLLTIRAALAVGLWRVFLAFAVIAYAFTMFAAFDALFLEPLGLEVR
jgi:hypothetical protein